MNEKIQAIEEILPLSKIPEVIASAYCLISESAVRKPDVVIDDADLSTADTLYYLRKMYVVLKD